MPATPAPDDPQGDRGLTAAEAAARLARDGPNSLPEPDRRSFWSVFAGVLREPMLLLLIAAAGLYALLGDAIEATLLALSVLLVIGLTVFQEERSEHALRALRELGAPRARALRDGAWASVPASELVVGDLIEVSDGDRVPADARLLRETDLQVDESMLTGESVPVRRTTAGAIEDSMLSASTLVVRGTALATVASVGVATAIGRIGTSMRAIRTDPGPMQVEIRSLVRRFAVLAGCGSLLVALLAFFSHGDWLQALLSGITLAIALIPEEFPVVLAVFLALGAWRMSRQRALVRRMSAIGTLGAVSVLCTDKTGTLTENRMRLRKLVDEREDSAPDAALSPGLRELLALAARACRTESVDPMDRALLCASADAGDDAMPGSRREYLFSPACPAVGQVRAWTDGLVLACKGAPETVASLCGLDDQQQSYWRQRTSNLARDGLRVLAVAMAPLPVDTDAAALPTMLADFKLHWRGLVAFADPLREGAAAAVAEARAAGVRVIMLTGDHVDTAAAIAAQAGIDAGDGVVTGAELEAMSEDALQDRLKRATVFARVRPEHKLRLVQALRRAGEVVAMTGDGVNDAPALSAAHVGIAMGGRGTDVAREAAAVVLLDDDFATIVGAVRMGRLIYDNIRRAFRYIVAVHTPIVGMALLPVLLGAPPVLLPLHVVFLELVIDPACSFVFEREPAAADLMQRPPRRADQRLLGAAGLGASLAAGGAMLVLVAVAWLLARTAGFPSAQVGAIAFTTLVAGNLGLMLVFRAGATLRDTLSRRNLAFAVVAGGTLLALLAATQVAAVAAWFRFAPPPFGAWLLAFAVPLAAAAFLKSARTLLVGAIPGAVAVD
ncbi:MAG: cation-translocating P-type ATPase [Arenimonas sp.]